MTEQEELAAQFETHRSYLHAIAYRMLGSHADADDAVQEAWLRLARTSGGGIEDLRGWLTTVTSRICLDALRRRGVRGEQPLELDVGALTREAVEDSRIDPEEEVVLAESVGLALYVVMDALTPAERVSFVLHDIFEVPFDAIAAILGRSTAAAKMLASRARGPAAAGRGPGDDVRAPGRAGASRARGRPPGRSRHHWQTAGHGHGLHGHRRCRYRDPHPDRPRPARPSRPLVGRVTVRDRT